MEAEQTPVITVTGLYRNVHGNGRTKPVTMITGLNGEVHHGR